MADDSTTGPAGGSENTGAASAKPAAPDAAIEEARIVEEAIVRPAPPEDRNNAPAALPPPLPSPPLAPESPHTPAVPQQAAHAPQESGKTEKKDSGIAAILKSIRLPERREAPGQARKPESARVFATALGQPERERPPGVPAERMNPPLRPELQPAKAPDAAHAPPPESVAGRKESAQESEGIASAIVAPLRTLKNDLQNIVREKKISLVRAVALESEKRGARSAAVEETPAAQARSQRTLRVLFASLLLVLLGAGALFGIYVIVQERSGIPPRETGSSILFAESTYALPLDNRSPLEVKRLLAQARGGGGTLGSITRLVPTVSETNAETIERPVTLQEFLAAIGASASPDALRALSGEFFFGIHTVDENAPLLVIPVLSYERAFAGLLAWEQTMSADLSPAFTPVPDQIVGAGGLPEKRRFEDVVMRNYDVRALKDDAGEIQLYYSFPTQRLLVIGESVYSFTEILNRLRAERKL